MGVPESEALQRPPAPFLDLAQIMASEHERLRPKRERQEALYPNYESGDTGDSEWAYRRDTLQWSRGWETDHAGLIGCQQQREPYPEVECRERQLPQGTVATTSTERLDPGEARSEAGRKSAGKRARQEDPSGWSGGHGSAAPLQSSSGHTQ